MNDGDAHELGDLNLFYVVVAPAVRKSENDRFVHRNCKRDRNPQPAIIVVLAENREEPSALGG